MANSVTQTASGQNVPWLKNYCIIQKVHIYIYTIYTYGLRYYIGNLLVDAYHLLDGVRKIHRNGKKMRINKYERHHHNELAFLSL